MDELRPLLQTFSQAPVAFLGGVLAGALRLNLTDDPLRSWLEQQGQNPTPPASQNGRGPNRITID